MENNSWTSILLVGIQKCLTHWGRVTHICVSKLTIIGSDNGLSPGRRQAIIWTNAGILLIGSLSEILIGILTFSLKKIHLKISSAKWRPFCFGLNVLRIGLVTYHLVVRQKCSAWVIYAINHVRLLSWSKHGSCSQRPLLLYWNAVRSFKCALFWHALFCFR